MEHDLRHDAAFYYDLFSEPPGDDAAFYLDRLPTDRARVLELGCGTGRVLLALTRRADYVLGVDLSQSMLAICDRKLTDAGMPTLRARTMCADITTLDVTDHEPGFDLVCAPFRVMQNLETDAQVDGLMRAINRHLKPGGEAILNTFKPRGGFAELEAFWSVRDGVAPCWTKPYGDGSVTLSDDCRVYRKDPLAVYPKLIYRRYDKAGNQTDEAVLDIVMRVWQAGELIDLVERHGFRVSKRFGGYHGEAWGEGPELVLAFTHA